MGLIWVMEVENVVDFIIQNLPMYQPILTPKAKTQHRSQMSFLAGRLAAAEGSYFLKESKQAVTRLAKKKPNNLSSSPSPSPSSLNEPQPDVLHEVLRHSLPTKTFEPLSDSSLATGSKWVLPHDPSKVSSISSDAQNPLRAYVSLPQVSFGPKRWQLPEGEHSFSASTANELRRDKYTHVNPEKLKAAAEGLSRVGMAFMVATTVVFGGAALTCGLAASKLELHNIDDIKTKGKDLVQPKLEMFREQFGPLRVWAESTSKKWHFEKNAEVKESPLLKELSKQLGAKSSN